MADLTQTAVEVLDQWVVGDRTQKIVRKVKRVKLSLTGQGTVANKIPASVFNFTHVHEAYNVITDGNTLLHASPSFDGSRLLLFNPNQATDANRGNPADITDTVIVTVVGW